MPPRAPQRATIPPNQDSYDWIDPRYAATTTTRRGFEDWATQRLHAGLPFTTKDTRVVDGRVQHMGGRLTMADLWPVLVAGGGIGLGALLGSGGAAGVAGAAGTPGAGIGAGTAASGAAAVTPALPSIPVTSGLPALGGASSGGLGSIVGAMMGKKDVWSTIATGASALGGALSNRSQTQTSTPTLDPALRPLQSTILQMIQQRLASGTGLPAGYEAGEISNINRAYDLVSQRTANDLTARGLGTSPVAGVVEGNNQLARAGSIADLLQRIPLLNRQLQTEDVGIASNLLAQGRGLATTQPGNMLGGAFSNLAGMLGYLLTSGRLGNGNNGLGVGSYIPLGRG